MTRKNDTQKALWIGTLILLLAAWLRLGAFHEALVGADQSSILAAAADIAAFRDFPLVGIKSSIGVMQTATTPYLAAIPLLLIRRVIAVKWFFSILDLLALALLYRAVRQVFGRRAAAVTALLYATNPWVVEFIRWIWYQTLISTFATITFAAFLPLLSKKHQSRTALLLPLGLLSTALMGMVHLASVPWAALLVLLAVFIAWRDRRWKGFLVGVALAVIVAWPYLRFLMKTGFADIALILNSGSGETTAAFNWATYRLSLELLTGRQVFATPRSDLWKQAVVHAPALYDIIPITLVLALAWSVWRLWRKPQNRLTLALPLAWTLLAPTLFLFVSFHLQHFYLLFLFPAPYVLIGAWIEALLTPGNYTRLRTWTRRLATVALLGLCLWWTYIWSIRIGFEQHGKLRASTRAWLMDVTVDHVTHYLDATPDGEVILLATYEGGDLSAFDWVRNFVHSDRIRVVPTGEGFIIPAHETCYVLTDRATQADLEPVAEIAVERPELTVPASPPWRFYCTPARAPLDAPFTTWENGMDLLDAEITGEFKAGETLTIVTTWHYRAVAPKEYHLFNHLLLGETPVAQIDGAGVPTWYWRDDDVLVTQFALQLPPTLEPGTYRLLTGSYTWPDVERVFLTDGDSAYEIARWEHE